MNKNVKFGQCKSGSITYANHFTKKYNTSSQFSVIKIFFFFKISIHIYFCVLPSKLFNQHFISTLEFSVSVNEISQVIICAGLKILCWNLRVNWLQLLHCVVHRYRQSYPLVATVFSIQDYMKVAVLYPDYTTCIAIIFEQLVPT